MTRRRGVIVLAVLVAGGCAYPAASGGPELTHHDRVHREAHEEAQRVHREHHEAAMRAADEAARARTAPEP